MSAVLFDVPGPKARVRHRIYTVVGLAGLAAVLAWVLWTLWQKEQITPDKWTAFGNPRILGALVQGMGVTLVTAAAAIALAVAYGAVFAFGRLSDHAILRVPSVAIVEFFRAVPLVLLILFIFLGIGNVIGTFWSLVLGLTLYNGSVLAEIFRAGILAVPRGQSEAGYALGMRKYQVMTEILSPQAVRAMLPAIISQCIVALKDTALGYIIAAPGVTRIGQLIFINPLYRNPLAVGIVIAAFFIVVNYALSKLAEWVEARMRRRGTTPLPARAANIPDESALT
ncbi:MAG TPA: amino acid ABC transporter permease [Actinopolymorphaceae bacterium]